MIRKLFLFLLIVIALVGAGDWLLTTWAEGAIERRLKNAAGGSAHVEIDSWPVVTRALLSENIDQISVDLRRVTIQGVEVDSMQIEASGLQVDRARIFRRVDDLKMRNGSLTAVMSVGDLAAAMGAPVENLPDSADVSKKGDRLLIEGQDVAGFPEGILPCDASGSISNGEVRLRCVLDSVPDIVLQNLPR